MQLQRVLPLLGVAVGLSASALYLTHNQVTADAIPVTAITPVVIPSTIPFGIANLDLTTSLEGPLQYLDLAGPRVYGDTLVDDVYMGDGRRDLNAVDIRRTLYLYRIACVIQGLVIIAMAVLVTQ